MSGAAFVRWASGMAPLLPAPGLEEDGAPVWVVPIPGVEGCGTVLSPPTT